METKTIGSFIAALRKANGMTQKDLAERLNVSDKTVSRWERDDGAPDLSLIPVIAEIFGVTCDELLKGARNPIQERIEIPQTDELTQKSEKQRKRLLAVSFSHYKTQCYIAMGCSLLGVIAAMICNFGFLRAYIGFFSGIIFYLISAVFQAIVINRAFLAVSDDNLDSLETGNFRWNVIMKAEMSLGLTIALLGFVLPLIIIPGKSTVGLNADYWFVFGSISSFIMLLIFAIVCYYLNVSLLKKEAYRLSEKEERNYYHNHKLKFNTVAGLVAALVITLLFHAFGGEMIWSTYNLAAGTTFYDYESFITYMEQDIPSNELAVLSADVIIFDQYGNIITEDEANKHTLEDINGKVVCTYIRRNEAVTSVQYAPKDGTVLPITVITYEEQRVARKISEMISLVYCIIYPLEFMAALFIYYRKRSR